MSEKLSSKTETWEMYSAPASLISMLVDALSCSEQLAHCIAKRDNSSVASAQDFLTPSREHFHDPMGMLNMPQAIARLEKAISKKERIRVVTDYDVDGTTSSLILQSTLKILGAGDIDYHIPDRMKEGYGFSVEAAEKAARDGVGLIVTADIGVKDHAAVRQAHQRGVDVLICDHHLPSGASVPEEAIVLCPPQAGCPYPNKALAACGVSWKLASALLDAHPKRDPILNSLLKLAAIGTVADVVDLACPENRAIVTFGLAELNRGPHSAGLRSLLEVSGLRVGEIGSSDLGFRVGPRINAAGRLASATTVVELLQCRDQKDAEPLARALDEMNTARRAIQERILNEAISQVTDPSPEVVLVHGKESDGWHRGVTGIVAGRLRDHFNCPALVITVTEAGCVGSMRSTPGVHSVALLESADGLLDRYGGHPAAAGFSLSEDRIAEFKKTVEHSVRELASPEKAPTYCAELRLESSDLCLELAKELQVLEPHGKGNEAVLAWVGPLQLAGIRTLKDKHLKAGVRVGSDWVDLLWWNAGHLADELLEATQVELLGHLGINRWRGQEKLQVEVRAMRIL